MIDMSLNTLMGGTTGSGKSTILNNMIENVAKDKDGGYMVMLDPKKLELEQWHHHPKTLWYADTVEECVDVLLRVNDLMWVRYDRAKQKGLKASDEPNVFVFIDEMTMLMKSKGKKELAQIIGDLCILGRAAKIHLIMCAQNCTQQYIPAIIRDNAVNIVCLHQRDEGKYRYLLGKMPAAGPLPDVGYAYVSTPWMNRPVRVKAEDVWKTLTERETTATNVMKGVGA